MGLARGYLTTDEINVQLNGVLAEDINKIKEILIKKYRINIYDQAPDAESIQIFYAPRPNPVVQSHKTKEILIDELFSLIDQLLNEINYEDFIGGYLILNNDLNFIHETSKHKAKGMSGYAEVYIKSLRNYDELSLAAYDESDLNDLTIEECKELYIFYINSFCHKVFERLEEVSLTFRSLK